MQHRRLLFLAGGISGLILVWHFCKGRRHIKLAKTAPFSKESAKPRKTRLRNMDTALVHRSINLAVDAIVGLQASNQVDSENVAAAFDLLSNIVCYPESLAFFSPSFVKVTTIFWDNSNNLENQVVLAGLKFYSNVTLNEEFLGKVATSCVIPCVELVENSSDPELRLSALKVLVNVSSYTKCNSFIQEALSVQGIDLSRWSLRAVNHGQHEEIEKLNYLENNLKMTIFA
ncbi:uncharacterized protein LOC134842979 isoform X2 [Symsagittifera roscoffensis]|uniref:uncharacterized protein LOC134842979 isoform X2 n=1 Tax=Symsagittifera roscoffensis TaxID=84072 RepID=UPI00307B58E6